MAYDPKCAELARYFLQDTPGPEGELLSPIMEEKVKDLAQEIQDTVEAYILEGRA
jgi:hypothetical protein